MIRGKMKFSSIKYKPMIWFDQNKLEQRLLKGELSDHHAFIYLLAQLVALTGMIAIAHRSLGIDWRWFSLLLPAGFGAACVDLPTYRLRHALYKLDPDLQAAHASAPFVMSYDDHEVVLRPYRGELTMLDTRAGSNGPPPHDSAGFESPAPRSQPAEKSHNQPPPVDDFEDEIPF